MPALTWSSGMLCVFVAMSTAEAETLRTQARRDETTLRNITTTPGPNANRSGHAPQVQRTRSLRERCQEGDADNTVRPRLFFRVRVYNVRSNLGTKFLVRRWPYTSREQKR